MEFNIRYGTLFKNTILHYYYLNRATLEFSGMSADEQAEQLSKYDISSFFDIVPTTNSRLILRNNKLIFKKQPDGFSVITALDAGDNTKSFYSLNDINLTFLLVQKNPYFYNATALPLSGNNNQIYYFSNRAGLQGVSFPSLSLNYPAYAAGNDYEMGSLVIFGGNVYEAIETIVNSSTNPDQPNSGWETITNEHYANITDRISLYHQFIPFTLPSSGLNVTLQLTDVLGNIVQTTSDNSVDGILERRLNVQKLFSGRYTLVITNNADLSIIHTQQLYLLNEMYRDPIFGIIEISGDTSLGSYRLTDNLRNLNVPDFRLSFKNRSTVWRYINAANRSVILETGANPNTSIGFIPVVINGSEQPNPSINVIKPETDKIVSEIFINT
jgi:hypothetical protein